MSAQATRSAAPFNSTQWSRVLALHDADENTQARALAELCRAYWFPLYAFARRRGLSRHDAEDAVQEFFHRVGDAVFFQKAAQEKGKLRTFVLTAFTRLLADQHQRAHAQKRGGGAPHFSLDVGQAESWLEHEPAMSRPDPVLSFERHWALTIMRSAIDALRAEAGHSPKAVERFDILSRFLNPETGTAYSPSQAAADLNMTTGAVTRAIHRLRQHFRLAVRDLVADTLPDPCEADVTEEMQQLQNALLARGGAE